MSEKIISPGVFTRENDQSFLATGVGQIGAVIIGPTELGPAFQPTQISNANDFQALFGDNSDKTYVPYTVKNYLKNAGIVTVVRVLGEEGWSDTMTRLQGQNDYINIMLGTQSVAILAVTATASAQPDWVADAAVTGSGINNGIILTSGSTTITFSLDKSSPNHILKVFGADPLNHNGANDLAQNLYCYQLFQEYGTLSGSNYDLTSSIGNLDFVTNDQYDAASTPWIQSQKISGTSINLFRFITLSDGTNVNKKFKVAIDNITKPIGSGSYGTFNVVVRDFGDSDTRQLALETYGACTLDPNSPNYVLKMIGDKYKTTDSDGRIDVFGEFENRSKYVRIEGVDGLGTIANTIVPFGHSAYYNPVEGSATFFIPVPMTVQQGPAADVYNAKYNWGIDLTKQDAQQFCMPIMDGAVTNISGSFNLDTKLGHVSSSVYSASLSSSAAPKEMLKFVVAFQGGWDGIPPNRVRASGENITAANFLGFDCSSGASAGTTAFKKAINTVANADEIDMNMMILPGVMQNYHSYIIDHAVNLCEERQDTFFVMDAAGLNDSAASTLAAVAGLDTNYAATYFPWVKISDSQRNKNVWVPPSVVLAGVIAFNDRVAASWYAPAGLNRGGLTDVIDVKKRLTHSDRDSLYEGRVNPIAIFPGQGPSVWGQKTLQQKASALDRVNVRRLLIELKKFFASTAKYIVFEPNTNQTRQQFLQIVNPYMDSVQRKSGVYAYKVVMDETNNTPDVIDRNTLVGAVYIQPTRAAEFIELTFNILPTGATFS